MPKKSIIRIPSLQHFSVLLGSTVDNIEKRIRKLSDLPPVSYSQLRQEWIFDLIRLGVPLSVIEKACACLRGELNRESNLGAVRALADYIRLYRPNALLAVDKLYYPIGRGLRVPVNPPGVIVDCDGPKLFWPSFWKEDKFDRLTKSVFGTILEKSIFRLPDYTEMPLAFVDLSAAPGTKQRSMKVLDRKDFPPLSDDELRTETDKFVEAYLRVRSSSGESVHTTNATTGELPLFLDTPTF